MISLKRAAEELGLKVVTAAGSLERNISGGYASDLMSDVIAHAAKDNIWVTLQTHQNIVGVASLKELAGIIIVNQREPEARTRKKAEQEGIPILVSELPAFEVVGKLHGLGISGMT